MEGQHPRAKRRRLCRLSQGGGRRCGRLQALRRSHRRRSHAPRLRALPQARSRRVRPQPSCQRGKHLGLARQPAGGGRRRKPRALPALRRPRQGRQSQAHGQWAGERQQRLPAVSRQQGRLAGQGRLAHQRRPPQARQRRQTDQQGCGRPHRPRRKWPAQASRRLMAEHRHRPDQPRWLARLMYGLP